MGYSRYDRLTALITPAGHLQPAPAHAGLQVQACDLSMPTYLPWPAYRPSRPTYLPRRLAIFIVRRLTGSERRSRLPINFRRNVYRSGAGNVTYFVSTTYVKDWRWFSAMTRMIHSRIWSALPSGSTRDDATRYGTHKIAQYGPPLTARGR